MAAEDAAKGKPASLEESVLPEGLKGVLRAGGGEAAAGGGKRRDAHLVESYQQHQRKDRRLAEVFPEPAHLPEEMFLRTVSTSAARAE